MTRAALALLPVLFVTGACRSQWYPEASERDIARTDVVIRTDPTGAEIRFDGTLQTARAPMRIPVEYEHTETLYERQTNYGDDMREGMGTLATILTAPIWIPASLIHHREELRRHEYAGNRHVVTANLSSRDEATESIELHGEAVRNVTLSLVKSK